MSLFIFQQLVTSDDPAFFVAMTNKAVLRRRDELRMCRWNGTTAHTCAHLVSIHTTCDPDVGPFKNGLPDPAFSQLRMLQEATFFRLRAFSECIVDQAIQDAFAKRF